MDGSTIAIIAVVVVVAAIWFFMRNRTPAAGTYNDPKVSSSGSIGGGTRAHDDPKVRSGGSIGGNSGGARVYDNPNVDSGGSIGNQQTTPTRQTRRIGDDVVSDDVVTSRGVRNNGIGDDAIGDNYRNRNADNRTDTRDVNDGGFDDDENRDKPTYNDRGVKSGGSIGSN